MMDISEGMSYLHNSRHPNGKIKPVVYHQDLKSANVLLSMENGMLRGKISDFGLSAMRTKTQKQDGSISKSVFSGGVTHIGGTRVYMAPELSQSSTFTRECDVYSL